MPGRRRLGPDRHWDSATLSTRCTHTHPVYNVRCLKPEDHHQDEETRTHTAYDMLHRCSRYWSTRNDQAPAQP